MREQPNPPDRDDPVTERAVSMERRPASSGAGAGRAINAAFSRHRSSPSGESMSQGHQERGVQGAGYPTEDRDDVDPEDPKKSGFREGEEAQGLETGDGQLPDLMPERDDLDPGEGAGRDTDRGDHAPGMETGDGQLEELLAPPGGNDLGGDRDTEPDLNGGHGIRMLAPEEGDVPIEEEDTEDSIVGHGHEAKAAWNRDRITQLQSMENDERGIRPGTSEALGQGGAVLAGAQTGWEGGNASPTIDQETDPEFDHELSETEEVLGDMQLEDANDVMEDDSVNDPDNAPDLPEHRDLPDDGIDIEERLIATDGEDPISAGAELGVVEDLEMEDLNETDDIEQAYEDQRDSMDSAMDSNERRGGVEDD